MREQKHSQASRRSAIRFNVGTASFPPLVSYGGRNFPVVQSGPYITRRDGLPIAFAGLWENAKELHGTAAIVTTAASEETQLGKGSALDIRFSSRLKPHCNENKILVTLRITV